MPGAKPILEINPDHPIIARVSADSERLDDWAHVLFDQATLSEGAPLSEPARYVERINRLLGGAGDARPESDDEPAAATKTTEAAPDDESA